MGLTAAGGTVFSKTPGAGVLGTPAVTDPPVQVLVDVYRLKPYPNVGYAAAQERQLLFKAGVVIKQSQWDAEFPAIGNVTVSPATVLVAGGTPVTITGPGYTADGVSLGGFMSDATVTIGGANATSIVVVDPNTITCVAPAHGAGAVNIVVSQSAGSVTKTLTNAVTYA